MIYLDNSATTKPHNEVIKTINEYIKYYWTNPSSLYSPSIKLQKDIYNAKKIIADFINAKPDEIYFTSCGSESNCWAIQGFVNSCRKRGRKCSVITTTIEHHSIMECVDNLYECDIHFVGVDKKGRVNYRQLDNILKSIPDDVEKLVSIQYANNEIGTIQNINKLSCLSHKYNSLFHTDATQIFGHKIIDVKNIDMLTASGHKLNAPKGIGFLYINYNIKDKISPLIYGTQMDGMRGGTENVPYIMGFAKAVELCSVNIKDIEKESELKLKYFEDSLTSNFDITINGDLENKLLNNISITFENNINAESLIYLLDTCGIYISSGSACNSFSVKPSHVLKSIGLTDKEATRTIRISFDSKITKDEIDKVISEFKRQIKILESII